MSDQNESHEPDSAEKLLGELNPPQKAAVETLNGPLLVLAGAGSGKTRVLSYRMANLILQGECTPGQILAVTFTNKAAREMCHRIEGLLKRAGVPLYEPLWISTFHSSCARILRSDIYRLGYQPFFVIYDDGDQLSLIKKICEEMNLNDKVFPPKAFRHQFSEAKMLGLSPAQVPKHRFFRMDETTLGAYQMYEDEMKRANALDFDDLLLKTYQLLRDHPDVLQSYREKFRYILVDEYQDTNHIQYLIVKLLAEEHRNLCVVGDEDQSIYSWRGADIKNILDFEKDFAEAQTVKLEENYRSSRNIVEAASKVIANNTERKGKVLFTNNPEGSKIVLQGENNEYDEARFVVYKIQDLLRNGHYKMNDIAVFYRTNAQSRVIEEQLRSYSVPYRILGSVKFYERKEIKDILCYMRLLLNPSDDVAFYRVVNVPTRGLGKTTIEEIQKYSMQHKISAYDAAYEVATQRLVNPGACTKLQNFRHMLEGLKEKAKTFTTNDIYLQILDVTQYAQKLREENTPESATRIENLESFQNAIMQFEEEREDEATLTTFLEEMALVSDADKLDENAEAVTLMTLHLSKGLEYKNVFVIGLEEKLFPSGRSLDNPDLLEEERRLCYVGMTRARENLFMSFAKTRRVYGVQETAKSSRFLEEIPEEYITTNSRLKRPAFLDKYANKYAANVSVRDELGLNSPTQHSNSSYGGSKSAYGKSGTIRRPKGAEKDYSQTFPEYDDDFAEDTFEKSAPTSFTRGERVRHSTFGVGTIFQVEGAGPDQKVSVLFSDNSLKKFAVKHARLEKV